VLTSLCVATTTYVEKVQKAYLESGFCTVTMW